MSSSLPLLYSPLNPFTPSTLYLSLFFCTPLLPPHHSLSLSLSLYHTLYSLFLLLIPLSLFHHLSSYLSPLLSPPLSPTFTSCTSYTLHSSISFSFYNFLSLTLSPLPFTSPLMSSPSISSFIAFPADLIDCPSVVLHDFGLSEFTYDDSDIIGVLGWLIE